MIERSTYVDQVDQVMLTQVESLSRKLKRQNIG